MKFLLTYCDKCEKKESQLQKLYKLVAIESHKLIQCRFPIMDRYCPLFRALIRPPLYIA